MFETGERVIYGIHGVCTVTGTDYQQSGGKQTEYLVLEPLNRSGSRFLIPTHNAVAMTRLQRLLSKSELEQLLRSPAVHAPCWISDEGQRKKTYRELINSSDRTRLMAMVHSLYVHKSQQSASGRKVHLCDENFLHDAEKLLASEITAVMDMGSEEARNYLRMHLQK